jgi:hypothetical protein
MSLFARAKDAHRWLVESSRLPDHKEVLFRGIGKVLRSGYETSCAAGVLPLVAGVGGTEDARSHTHQV